jgi:hypothetical protein
MKISLQSVTKKLGSLRFGAVFITTMFAASVAVSGSASAMNPNAGPKYFDVQKGSPQSICYKQLGPGWKKLGFKSLDQCLRYVSTPAPKVKSDCNAGWWYVYGFKSIGHCKLWVTIHGGGGYDAEDDPNENF